MNDAQGADSRLTSLDQFRGYTVLGMFVVNFLNSYPAVPAVFRHHNTYCSYADTIMPQFFFAVGFAYRMMFLRRLATIGRGPTYAKVMWRNLGLILIGIVIYHLDGGVKAWSELQALGLSGFLRTAFQRNVFQALVHIGVTSLWVMPVIGAGPIVRIGFALASVLGHFVLSNWFYYDWVMKRPGIDGGPLGFLTWTAPLLVGSLAYDALRQWHTRSVGRLASWACLLMFAGYALSCLRPEGTLGSDGWSVGISVAPPPFVPPSEPVNIFTMSQRAGSASYLVFGAGFSLALFAVFVWACDEKRFQWGPLRTFGSNALAGYIIHDLVIEALKPYTPRDAPLWYVMSVFCLFLAITYLFIRYLERNHIYLRL
jgi:predicted acyltransferase